MCFGGERAARDARDEQELTASKGVTAETSSQRSWADFALAFGYDQNRSWVQYLGVTAISEAPAAELIISGGPAYYSALWLAGDAFRDFCFALNVMPAIVQRLCERASPETATALSEKMGWAFKPFRRPWRLLLNRISRIPRTADNFKGFLPAAFTAALVSAEPLWRRELLETRFAVRSLFGLRLVAKPQRWRRRRRGRGRGKGTVHWSLPTPTLQPATKCTETAANSDHPELLALAQVAPPARNAPRSRNITARITPRQTQSQRSPRPRPTPPPRPPSLSLSLLPHPPPPQPSPALSRTPTPGGRYSPAPSPPLPWPCGCNCKGPQASGSLSRPKLPTARPLPLSPCQGQPHALPLSPCQGQPHALPLSPCQGQPHALPTTRPC